MYYLDHAKSNNMLVHLENDSILSRIFVGTRLIVIFQNRMDIHNRKVLELTEVVGLIDQSTDDEVAFLRIDESGSPYAHDLSMRMQRPEIVDFPEAFLFTDTGRTQFCFRVCAKGHSFSRVDGKGYLVKLNPI